MWETIANLFSKKRTRTFLDNYEYHTYTIESACKMHTLRLRGLDMLKNHPLAFEILSQSVFVEDETAYTIEKGRAVHLPMHRDDLFLVFVHELAHIASLSVGHTPEFWRNVDAFMSASS
jgi:hypothetical protein